MICDVETFLENVDLMEEIGIPKVALRAMQKHISENLT